MAGLQTVQIPPTALKNTNKEQLKNLIIDAAILDFMRRISLLLNSNLDSENLDFMNGLFEDEKPTSEDIIWFYNDIQRNGLLLSYCLPTLHNSTYDPIVKNFRATRQNFGSVIRDIYHNIKEAQEKHTRNSSLDNEIEYKTIRTLFIIQMFRNEIWGKVLPDILAQENLSHLLTGGDKEDILFKFDRGSRFIERKNINDDITNLLFRFYTKVVRMDNKYKIYFTDEPKA